MGRLLLALTVGMGVVAVPAPASVAGNVRLVWDPNPPAEAVVSYRVFLGPVSRHDPDFSGYVKVVDVGDALGIDVGCLECGPGPCYAAVTARSAAGLESEYSVEVLVGDGCAAPFSEGGGRGGGCFVNAL